MRTSPVNLLAPAKVSGTFPTPLDAEMASAQFNIRKLMATAAPVQRAGLERALAERVKHVKLTDRYSSKINKTEGLYAKRLFDRKLLGLVRNYRFTGHRRKLLPLDDRKHFNPDFLVILPNGRKEWHEVKGGHIWDDAKDRFDWAAQRYPQYTFRMWQYVRGSWTEIRTRNEQTNEQETP